MSKPRRRRAYDASRRQERARENQERMLASARRLFAAHGYAETTIEMIADDAEVAVPTVYAAFGSKRELLSRMLGRALSDDPSPRPILQSAGAEAVFAQRDPTRALAMFAAHMAQIQERIAPTYEVIKSAARTEPAMTEMMAVMQRDRLTNLTAVATHLAVLGALRDRLAIDEAAHTIWVLASTEVRQLLLGHAGWSSERYQEWLAATLTAALLR